MLNMCCSTVLVLFKRHTQTCHSPSQHRFSFLCNVSNLNNCSTQTVHKPLTYNTNATVDYSMIAIQNISSDHVFLSIWNEIRILQARRATVRFLRVVSHLCWGQRLQCGPRSVSSPDFSGCGLFSSSRCFVTGNYIQVSSRVNDSIYNFKLFLNSPELLQDRTDFLVWCLQNWHFIFRVNFGLHLLPGPFWVLKQNLHFFS